MCEKGRKIPLLERLGWLFPVTGRWRTYLAWVLLYGLFGACMVLPDVLYYLAANPKDVRFQLWVLCLPVTPSIDRYGAYAASAVWLGPVAIGWSASLPPNEFELSPVRQAVFTLLFYACRLGAPAIAGAGLILAGASVARAVRKVEKPHWLRWIALSWPAVQMGLNALLSYIGSLLD